MSATTHALHLDRFEAAKSGLPGDARARAEALTRYAKLGVPTPKLEAWHFTSLKALDEAALAPSDAKIAPFTAAAVAPHALSTSHAHHQLVFVDGRFRADLSRIATLPKGVVLTGWSAAKALPKDFLVEAADTGAMRALNAAYAADGAILEVPAGTVLAAPVHLIFLGASGAAHVRNRISLGEGASATVLETYAGAGRYWTNAVTDVSVAATANLKHLKLQTEGGEAFHTAATAAHVAAKGVFDSFVLSLGGKLARNEIDAVLKGEGGRVKLEGAYLARGRQHIDNTTTIDHVAAHCDSEERYRGVLDDHAYAAFQGRIVVRPDAQKTNAHQLNENLLLSDRAEIGSKPELEIHADDVKCGHGATAGEIDEQALFYLRARGIGLEQARGMLIEAFVSEMIGGIADEAIRDRFTAAVGGWLYDAQGARRAA